MDYLTTGEAAKACGVRINTIKHWIQKGNFEAVLTPGGHWRILKPSFEDFLRTWNANVLQPQQHTEAMRILIVDDDPQIHDLVHGAMALSRYPCDISSAYDGYAGLIQIGLMRPQLLVLDIMLPEINGLEIIRRLKDQPDLRKNMRILALTGAQDRKLVVNKLKAAAPDAILFKPAGIQELLNISELLLEQSASANKRNITHA